MSEDADKKTAADKEAGGDDACAKKKKNFKKDSPYHGKKPEYENPGHHDPSSGSFRGGGSKTSPLPEDAEKVYEKAIPADESGDTWFGKNEKGDIYRYQSNGQGKVHFNGSTNSERGLKVPAYVQKRLGG